MLHPDESKTKITIGRRSDNIQTSEKRQNEEYIGRTTLIYIVDDDELYTSHLNAQLLQYGFNTKIFRTMTDFTRQCANEVPDLALLDIALEDVNSTSWLSESDNKKFLKNIPLIFLSGHSDFQHRLATVRAGASGYLTKPFDIALLIEQIDRITNKDREDIYSVLVIDDSKTQLDIISGILQAHKIQVTTLQDTGKVLDVLSERRIDLIILDINMPECSGPEIARVVRQLEAYDSIPIVYLSTESSIERQLEAVEVGGDDFLSKPIKPAHLVSSVNSRIGRARTLKKLMTKDSLTGLLNHTSTKEKIATELSRSERINSRFVFAMIDIDHFKQVNDNYGHPMGDRVIQTLARLLRQRLRTTDVVGRYGGEEFVVGLLDTNITQAQTVLDGIRETFELIQYQKDDEKFSCTFSCGLAEFPHSKSLVELNKHADEALYIAKNQGRNQTVQYGESTELQKTA